MQRPPLFTVLRLKATTFVVETEGDPGGLALTLSTVFPGGSVAFRRFRIHFIDAIEIGPRHRERHSDRRQRLAVEIGWDFDSLA
jgi:hypothetical protein